MAKFELEDIKKIPHLQLLKIIEKIKARLKTNETVQKVFKKYGLNLDEIDYIPVCFADIDVSARTDHGIIYLNYGLLADGDFEEDDHYLVHEMTHFAQQTTGDGPTEGSTEDTYLDNKYEQEGFRAQTEYLSETRDDSAAKNYINKVLDHHDVPTKERDKRKEQLLQLAAELRGK